MDVVPKPQPSVDEGQWEEKVKAYHLPRAEINKVSARRARVYLTMLTVNILPSQVVMEYLVKEGFKDAVAAFQEESGINPGVNMSALDDQIKIRDAVEAGISLPISTMRQSVPSALSHSFLSSLPLSAHAGAIQEAVELVNDVDPEILDTNSTLYFHLQQQQLLELIKEVGCNPRGHVLNLKHAQNFLHDCRVTSRRF